MNIETSYPIFESGQVLTSAHLNDLVDYLEQQDRLSRRTLTGIGILCGFGVDVAGARVSISRGVAVTSKGFLIVADAQTYDRFRSYEVPVPTAEEATADALAEAQYAFLFPNGGPQIPVVEALDTDFAPAPGEPDPQPLSAAFLADKTVMLFLECQLESLKSCDVNDCSDKGAERRFTLRRLLVTRTQADAIIAQEAAIANRPVDRANHPRLALPYMRIEKLGLTHHKIASFQGLLGRILSIALKLAGELPQALKDAYAAYDYLLEDLYAEGVDPFPPTYFSNVWGQFALNVFMAQYFYDYMRDVAMAYNEFLEAASRYEAECLPDPARFPKHVLLGDTVDAPDAFATEFQNAAEVIAFSQGAATTGVGLSARPPPRRTHFIPAPNHCCNPGREEVRALFLRMHLLAYTYRTDGLMAAPVRVTPSRDDAAPLSERAIPFHYEFDTGADLFRNWSPRKTGANLLNTVYSYQFSLPTNNHPLWFRLDDQDFVRVEGIVGKPLGSVMAQLVGYKNALGVPISIEPVFMRLEAGDTDQDGQALDRRSAAVAAVAARKLLLCRISDQLDVIFLVIVGALFAFLVFLIRRLGRQATGTQAAPSGGIAGTRGNVLTAEAAPASGVATAFLDPATARRFRLDLPPEEEAKLRVESDALRLDLAGRSFVRGDVVAQLNPDAGEDTAARVFTAVKDDAAGGNLFDRTRSFVIDKGGSEQEVRVVYAKVALLEQSEQVMDALSVDTVADFDEVKFATAYRGFADSYQNYAAVVAAEEPSDDPAFRDKAQIAAAASTVASQTSAFAAGNIQSQISALIGRLFARLTLDGFARRNPGLEHRAGAPKGGTLVLAYVSRADLEKQAAPILQGVNTPLATLTTQLGRNQGAVALAGAFQELAAASADRTEDPLDEFIVLADFCLPYRCCDADCSDVVLSDRLSGDPFAEDVDPGPMAVPPLDRPVPKPPGTPPRRDFPIRNRPPVFVGRLPARGLANPIEGFIRPPRQEATLAGMVGISTRGNAVKPLPGAEVVLRAADGRERRISTEKGRFTFTTPAGEVAIRGAAPGHRGKSESVTLGPGETRDMTLLVVRRA